MTDKKLHFPSMDDPSSDLFIENEDGEYERFIPDDLDDDLDDWDLNDETDDGETGDGEKAAYDRAMELTAGEDDFQYFPSDGGEESNQRFSIAHLDKAWGASTQHNIGIANFFYKNFLNETLRREAESTGIASHYLLVAAFYKAAKRAEKMAMQQNEGETGMKSLKFKGMDKAVNKQLEDRAKDLAIRTYLRAKDAIIAKHGGISHG